MLISVIVPVYNVASYLEKCIESIVNQSYKDIEVIFVNDGSTDDSLIILEQHARTDNRIHIINQMNSGSSVARNTGLEAATGEYIVFLDSDDFWIRRDALELLVNKIEKTKDDIVVFQSLKYFHQGNQLKKTYEDLDLSQFEENNLKASINYLIRSGQIIACAWNKCVRRSILVDNSIRFIPGIVGEDIDWVIKLFASIQSIGAIDVDIHAYRQLREGAVTSTTTPKKVKDLFSIIKRWAIEMNNSDSFIKEEILALLAFEYAILIGQVNKLESKEEISEIKDYAYLLESSMDLKSRKVLSFYKVFGFGITSRIMSLYLKARQ